MIFLICVALHVIFSSFLFYSIDLMSYFSRLNILIYIYLSIFQVLFLDVINNFFIYLIAHITLSLFNSICA
jgi:hypothetical protein